MDNCIDNLVWTTGEMIRRRCRDRAKQPQKYPKNSDEQMPKKPRFSWLEVTLFLLLIIWGLLSFAMVMRGPA